MKIKFRPILLTLFIPLTLFIISFESARNESRLGAYFETPIYAIINIFIAIFFTYYLTHKKKDSRRKKDLIENIINKLLLDFSDTRMYQINSEEDIKFIRITQRSIDIRISLLRNFENEFILKEDIDYIDDNFKTYWDTICNHITDVMHLKNSETELFNFVTKIKNRFENITICLYR